MTAQTTPDTPGHRSWLPGFVALAAIWGSSFLFIKVGIRELHPVHLAGYRVATAALTLLVVLLLLRDRLPGAGRIWLHLTVVGAFQVALPFSFFAYGEQHIESLLAGIWNATTPLVVLPMAVLVFRTERLDLRRAVGLGLGFLGVLVVLGVWQGVGGAHFTGQLFCFAAAACYGFAIPYQRRFLASGPHSGLALSAGQLLTGVFLLALAAPLGGTPPLPTELSTEVLGSVLALGALGTGLAFVINMRNIRLVGASLASTVTYLVPVFAVLVGVLVLDEHLYWYQPVGALIVLAGVAVSQGLLGRRPGRRPVPATPAERRETAAPATPGVCAETAAPATPAERAETTGTVATLTVAVPTPPTAPPARR